MFTRWIQLSFFLFASLIISQDFIRPPNGQEHKVKMIDPVVHEYFEHDLIHQFFTENGYVVVKNVSDSQNRAQLVFLIDQIMQEKIPLSRRLGFLDLYHDDTLAQLRQDRRVYEVFANLFGSEKLWVVFDRVIHQKIDESEDSLPAYVDQNPITHPGFFNVQSMLALKDMDETTGTLALVPQSPQFFHEYAQWAKIKDGYVEHQGGRELCFVGLRLKEGEMVIWDSRTTHSRFRKEPKADRYAALITYTLAKEDPELIGLRRKYFDEGIGFNHHEAGLRATARPRCEISLRRFPERLSPLGRKLYGLDLWD
ncbi:MAG: hypothetical protein COT85_04085 [Chlamydiae bacterium CG10_big_fil_rev_8_21_14_0_10_42_34]|nr:MAG: hypothetical protein COT85_04085 [Chlamydiae bacterium CG10_big_fil_rev_8_21_14_0_10_42_34]